MRFLVAFLITALPLLSNENDFEDNIIPSSPDQIAHLTSDQDFLIGGVVSPLSGQPVLFRTDLIAKGAQSIPLNRVYIPTYMPCSFPKKGKKQEGNWETHYLQLHLKDNYQGWKFFPHRRLLWNGNSRIVCLTEPNGMTLNYQISDSNTSLYSSSYGISNFPGKTPSGKYDPRNTRIFKDGQNFTVHAADGTIRFYSGKHPPRDKWTWIYLLDKEILPNGKVLRYHYQHTALDHIESMDSKGRYPYASLNYSGDPKRKQSCHFFSSNGQMVDYGYEKRIYHIKIKDKKKDLSNNGYRPSPPFLKSVNGPLFRDEGLTYADPPLLENYSGKNEIFLCGYRGFGPKPHYRVHQLFFPVGPQDALHPLYDISYDPPIAGQKNGSTVVRNSDGTSTIYYFSSEILPIAIHYIGQDGALKKEKTFSWKPNHWIESIEVKDGQKNLLSKISYEYDRFGNPTLETLTGDLTGHGQLETYTTRRAFSDDGRHLLLREETEDGKVICYSYLPNSDLVTVKLTQDRDKIILREFTEYDDCNNLVQTIIDDGTSIDKNDLINVTQRKIKSILLRQQSPLLHMPEWVEEKYLEQGEEKLLKRTHLHYDQFGNVRQEDICDANGKHVYTLLKEYNERGTLLSETNALGHKEIYTDDNRGRIRSTTNFSNRLTKTFGIDAQGRVREQTEKGDDGIVHSSFFEYDHNDRLKQKIDPFQNTTRYDHDPIANKVIKTEFPTIVSPAGEAVRVFTHSTYDALGNEITKTDANGHSTFYRYNAYGSVIEITHPDEGKESFRYEKNGALAGYTDPEGLTITYKLDILGRVLSKTYFFNSQQIAEETFTYNGFHLLTETDKEGHVTEHRYDGAGRKIRETRCGRVIEFTYNALGQLAAICKHNQDNTLYIRYRRDFLDRVEEETKTDASEQLLYKINYTYDPDGNVKTVTRNINGSEALETFTYDSLGRLIEHKDALGYTDRTIYDENQLNVLGQKILKISHIDSCNIASVKTYDALSRLVKNERITPRGQTLSFQEKIYDPAGNLTYHREHVYQTGLFKNTQTIQYTYTPNNRTESLIKAYGTQDVRSTTYTYYPSGKLATKTLPSGVALSYAYDPLGYMERLDSSDGTIRHFFEHNLIGHLLSAADEKQNFSIRRKVDPFGNVIREEFPCGLAIEKDYDAFNRPTLIKINGVGEIQNEYNALSLKSVTRFSNEGESLYSHRYDEYDLNGNLVAESLIGNLGQVVHGTDLIGQRTFIASPYFTQSCSYDPNGNLLRSILDNHEQVYTYDGLSQLTSENNALYAYDSVYNRVQKNGSSHVTNDLNELADHSYDLNGNQSLKKTSTEAFVLVHDPLNRLVEATSSEKKISFVYDPLGRRLSKTVVFNDRKEIDYENCLYDGNNEIGAFTRNNAFKNLRILGLAKHKSNRATIAIELNGQTFAPILDVQGNIRRLVSVESRSIADSYDFTAFGERLNASLPNSAHNPWQFASKRFDVEFGLIYFGKRYYDPEHGRWIETDPAGFLDSINLYQYVFNNPFRYIDPRGEFVFAIPLLMWGAEIVLPSLTAVTTTVLCGAAAGAIFYGGYKAVQRLNEKNDNYSPADDYANYVIQQDKALEEEKKKKHNTNPFDGPVSDDVFVVDPNGNVIKVPQDHQLGSSEDGKCIQVKDNKGKQTGTRMDGKGHAGSHSDPKAKQPHAHVPGLTNDDGTPWLPIH